jgi:hypothetical protein
MSLIVKGGYLPLDTNIEPSVQQNEPYNYWTVGVNGIIENNTDERIIVKRLGFALNGVYTPDGYYSNVDIRVTINSLVEEKEPTTRSRANFLQSTLVPKYKLNQSPVIKIIDISTSMFPYKEQLNEYTVVTKILRPGQQFSMEPHQKYSINVKSKYEETINIGGGRPVQYLYPHILGYTVSAPSTSSFFTEWPMYNTFVHVEMGYVIDTTPFDCIPGTYSDWSACEDDGTGALVKTRTVIGEQPARQGGFDCDQPYLTEYCGGLLFKHSIDVDNPATLSTSRQSWGTAEIYNNHYESIIIEQIRVYVVGNNNGIITSSDGVNRISGSINYKYPDWQTTSPPVPDEERINNFSINYDNQIIATGLRTFQLPSPIEIRGRAQLQLSISFNQQPLELKSVNTQIWISIGYTKSKNPIDCIEGDHLTPYSEPLFNDYDCTITRSQRRVGDIQPKYGGAECSDSMFIDKNVPDLKLLEQAKLSNGSISPNYASDQDKSHMSAFEVKDNPIVIKEIEIVIDASRWIYGYNATRIDDWKTWINKSAKDRENPLQGVLFDFWLFDAAVGPSILNVPGHMINGPDRWGELDSNNAITVLSGLAASYVGFDMIPRNINGLSIPQPGGKCYVTVQLPIDQWITIEKKDFSANRFAIKTRVNTNSIWVYGSNYPSMGAMTTYMRLRYSDSAKIPYDCVPGTTFGPWSTCDGDPNGDCGLTQMRTRNGDIQAIDGGERCNPYEFRACDEQTISKSSFTPQSLATIGTTHEFISPISQPSTGTVFLKEVKFLMYDSRNRGLFGPSSISYTAQIKIGVAYANSGYWVQTAAMTPMFTTVAAKPTASKHIGGNVYELTFAIPDTTPGYVGLTRTNIGNVMGIGVVPTAGYDSYTMMKAQDTTKLPNPWIQIVYTNTAEESPSDCKINDDWGDWGECIYNSADDIWEESRSKYNCSEYGGADCADVDVNMCDTFGGEYCTDDGSIITSSIQELRDTHLRESRACETPSAVAIAAQSNEYVPDQYTLDGEIGIWGDWGECVVDPITKERKRSRTRTIGCPRYGGIRPDVPLKEWETCPSSSSSVTFASIAIATMIVVVTVIAAIVVGPAMAIGGLIVVGGLSVGAVLGFVNPNTVSKVKNSILNIFNFW